ncbi:MAG: GDP-L-fucose synthase [Desulfobacterales bacterium]|jgi:GDP-L-fucose synthase
MEKNSKIYIAGHTGLVGSALLKRLETEGCSNLVVRRHSDLDLTRQTEVDAFFKAEKPEYVFLAAAKVGGIMANSTYPAEFIYTNLAIQNNVIHAAWKTGVKHLLFLGSSCIYPKECPQPMKEDYLLSGPLEPTNEPYAIAKIAGIKMCQSYNRQYGTQYICVMPTNLYGPNDNFDLESSHVLPAMIRKFHLVKLANQGDWDAIKEDEQNHGAIPEDIKLSMGLKNSTSNGQKITSKANSFALLWGSGNPRREFLHVEDLADVCIFLTKMERKDFDLFFDDTNTPLINIGCGKDQKVKEIAAIVAEVVDYTGDVRWDQNKPDGTLQKLLDISKIKKLGWKPNIDLKDGIRSVYEWYLKARR